MSRSEKVPAWRRPWAGGRAKGGRRGVAPRRNALRLALDDFAVPELSPGRLTLGILATLSSRKRASVAAYFMAHLLARLVIARHLLR